MGRNKRNPNDEDLSLNGAVDPLTAAGQNVINQGQQRFKNSIEALQQFAQPKQPAVPLADDPARFIQQQATAQSRDAALANSGAYDTQLRQRLQQNAAAEQAQQNKQNALDEPFDTSGYTNYAQGGEVASDGYVSPPSAYPSSDYSDDDEISKPSRFEKLRGSMKATAEKDASEDPMEFMRKNKNMSIKGRKGVAF